MEGFFDRIDTVDPEVRAHINSLVSALGGTSIEEHGRYVLGDDAIGCLKDLRRWIKLYDEKLGLLDVKRALAEANFVRGDVLEILADWPDNGKESRLRAKISLLCLEMLVPLTWNIEIPEEEFKAHHHKHLPYIRLAQVGYKRSILQHDSKKILRQIVRICLPAMAEPRNERSIREEGIIRLVLYAFRNIAMINQPLDLPSDGDEVEISRSTTIDAFHSQEVFTLLLTIAANMGEEFTIQDVILLEVLFYLLKGVDPMKLFMHEDELEQTNTEVLKELLRKEKAMLAGYARYAPTRHNRFGTMLWLKRNDERISTISGQSAISGPSKGLQYLDKTKKWNKPKVGRRHAEEKGAFEFDLEVPLSSTARRHLRKFVEDFLDSAFNPLFIHLRKSIERELDRVLEQHKMQYFYLVSWFLKAECARREYKAAKKARRADQLSSAPADDEGFGIVASVMSQETFILLSRFMQLNYDVKAWNEVNAGMKCFTQILHTVQQMEESSNEDDQEIAENIQNRIFYEGSTHDLVVHLLHNYKDQGRGYLDAVTELTHNFIRMLERYSKQNIDMQIRTRRRQRKKIQQANPDANTADNDVQDIDKMEVISRERKFDFAKASARFMTQQCVNTFVEFTRLYRDLNAEQLKRAHRFFYRVAFKVELTTFLFRADIIQLFHNMIRSEQCLDHNLPCFKEWEELVRQIFKRLLKRLDERPALVVEMLFSKMSSSLFYLEHGFDKEVTKSAPRPAAELEVNSKIEEKDRIGVVTEALVSDTKSDLIRFVKDELARAVEERQAWAEAEAARKEAARKLAETGNMDGGVVAATEEMDDAAPIILLGPKEDDVKAAMFKNGKLRLLMTLCGMKCLGEDGPEASWYIKSEQSSEDLKEALKKIKDAEMNLSTLANYDDAKEPESYLKRVPPSASARRAREELGETYLSSDSEGEDSFDEAALFPDGGPTARKPDHQDKRLKMKKKSRERDEISEAEKARRAKKRAMNERERRKKIKSDVWVHDSDDEEDQEKDEEFFRKEEERRKEGRLNVLKAMKEAKDEAKKGKKGKRKATDNDNEEIRKKRRSGSEDHDSSSDDNDMDDARKEVIEISSDASSSSDDDSDEEAGQHSDEEMAADTPISSQALPHSHMEEGWPAKAGDEDVVMAGVESSPEPTKSSTATVRRARAGFVIDDSDSE